MSFNFTGSTNRRQVNLGSRNLLGKNKNMFLKSAQLERERRETARLHNQSATIIQSACRRYISLLNWRESLSQSWKGESIIQFKFFYSYLITIQDPKLSIWQIDTLIDHINVYSTQEKNMIINTIVEAFVKLANPFNVFAEGQRSSYLEVLQKILQLMELLINSDDLVVIETNSIPQFTSSLIYLYFNNIEFISYYIFSLCKKLSIASLLGLFTDTKFNIMNYIDTASIDKFIYFQNYVFHQVSNNKSLILDLSDLRKLSLLYNISLLLYKYPELSSNRETLYHSTFPLIQLIFDSVSHKILLKPNMQVDYHLGISDAEDESLLISGHGPAIMISHQIFDAIRDIILSEDFKLIGESFSDPDNLVDFISSLLRFISIIDDERANALKLNVDLNWILKDKNSALINHCFKNIESLPFYHDFIQSKSNIIYISSVILDESNRKWRQSLSIFQEFLSNIISLTSEDGFFNSIMISKLELTNFIKFLKTFCSEILLKYRDINKPANYNAVVFLQLFKKSLSLLHTLYIKDLNLQLLEDQFWILSDYEVEFNSIASSIPAIDKLHYDLLELGNIDDQEDDSYDFLQNSKLTRLYKYNIPKKIIDSFYILTYAAYMVPFEKRAEIFHAFIEHDKSNNNMDGWFPMKVEGVVSRENILFDSFQSFGNLRGADFKKPFSVQFVNAFGEKEAGIDGGGLTKELLTTLVLSSFIPSEENRKNNKGLQFFKEAVDYKLYCNPEFFFKLQYERNHPTEKIPYSCSNEDYLKINRFLGMIIGKCLYDNVLLDISFASFFLNTCAKMGSKYFRNLIGDKINIIEYNNSFDELKKLDSLLYQSLNYVLHQVDDAKFENMSLLFSVNDLFVDSNGKKYHVEVPLLSLDTISKKPIEVNVSNKMKFVRLMTYFKLSKQTDLAMKHFVEGLFQIIKPHWLLLFNPYELQTLISGGDEDIDIDDLEENVEFGGFLKDDQTVIDLFQILREFSSQDRGKFIKFVTSSSKQPLLGFKELNPKFGIRNSGSDASRLPTASTCVNLLKIPDYRNKKILKEKLLYSINSKAGFDLS